MKKIEAIRFSGKDMLSSYIHIAVVMRRSLSASKLPRIVMDWLTFFGLFAVTAMLLCYALEDLSPWFILAFAVACALASTYGFLQGAWPFGLVEAIWCFVALRRWSVRTGS